MNRMNLGYSSRRKIPEEQSGARGETLSRNFLGLALGLSRSYCRLFIAFIKGSGLAGAVMATIAFYFLNRLYQQTGSAEAVVFSSFLAAGLKGLDLIFSPLSFMDIINPAQAIIIEGLLAALALQVLSRESIHSSPRIVPSCLLFSLAPI